jgi:hypothetical protein
MRKKTKKKLSLSAESLRKLSLEQVSGGRIPIPTDRTYSLDPNCPHRTIYCRVDE